VIKITNQENEIVKALNTFYYKEKINAFAHRLRQFRYAGTQLIDILSDSSDPNYYCGIEAKSFNGAKYNRLNFKSHFSNSNEEKLHQLKREYLYCSKVGRKAFVAVETRMGAGKPKSCYFIPIKILLDMMENGTKSISINEISAYPSLPRSEGKYVINKKVWAKIVA